MRKRPAEVRFWEKVDKSDASGCWLWTAHLNRDGYGRFNRGHGQMCKAHRFAYELAKGPIPDGLMLDHLCRVRRCVNPDHLRPSTARENTLAPGSLAVSAIRKARTHCPLGHELDMPNLVRANWLRGLRTCLACHRGKTTVRNHRRRRGVELDYVSEAHKHYLKIMPTAEAHAVFRRTEESP